MNNKNTVKPPRGPMGGFGQMAGAGVKAKDFKGTVKKLIGYMGKYKWAVLIVWAFAVVSTIFMIVGPKILGNATDELINGIMDQIFGTGTGIDFAKIGGILLTLLFLYLTSTLFSYIQGYIMTGVTMKVTFQMRKDLNQKIFKLPFKYYDKTNQGEVLSRITNDVDTISQSLNQSMTQIVTSVTSLIGTIIMMFTISWKLALVALCVIPISFVFVGFVIKKSQKYFKKQQKYLGNVNGHVEEMYGSQIVVRAFNGQKESEKNFKEYNDKLYKSSWKANFLSGLMFPITSFIGNIGYVAVCVLGGYYAINGSLTIGGIQSFIQYVRSFMQPIQNVANISNVLQQTAAASERVFEFLEEENEEPDKENAISIKHDDNIPDTDKLIHVKSDIEFKNVSFGYNPEDIIINNFSVKIKEGQKVAIVGPTGAGKTTIVKLLMRFYDINSGEILIDGYNIKDFKRSELRSLFGMVLQDTWLFNGTISDNIKYGKPDATKEEMKKAAKAAQVDHFVSTLSNGYNVELNEEATNISGGQKQLLTIARVILANPQILILDEATSNVDTRTEVLIQKAMDNLMKGRTSFIIAHRLSTIRNADVILVMKDGDIIETGKHEELISKNGFYANLYNSQFESAS